MEINWNIVIIVGVIAVALIAYLIRQNFKDQKDVEKHFNQLDRKRDDDAELNDDK